MLVFCV